MSPEEVAARGWDAVDVVFVSGDAYVDHPSFAMALLGRLLESEGYRVAILSQPDWHSHEPWQRFGRPRLCFAVSAGNMDSMLNHYTAARKVRNDDAYSPGGQIGRRPDRATLAYCQRARAAYKDVPIVVGGVEASLRRLAHYDYWSDKVRRSIILDAKADLLVYGMGERPLVEIVRRLDQGESVHDLRDVRGIVYRLGASEPLAEETVQRTAPERENRQESPASKILTLPSYEQVSTDPAAFAEMTRLAHRNAHPEHAQTLVQYHGREAIVINPPAEPLAREEMDHVYGLPFTRSPHPSYGDQKIPAHEVVKDSIQIVRGCFGGCTFCSIAAHEGRVIQSRGRDSILAEIRRLAARPGFSGVVSDLGGPTANMYGMNCSRPEIRAKCRRSSCLDPKICKLLNADHGPLIELMKAARRQPGIQKILIASGIRMDLALRSTAYLSHLARHHVGGHLKVAPEHVATKVLQRMKKPSIECHEAFSRLFLDLSRKAGKRQYLVHYFMAGHPGCDLDAMIELAVYLKRNKLRPQQVQDFIPGPFDIATCMYHTGLDPMTGQAVYVARGARERRLQRALLQYFKPENDSLVREALKKAGRVDLIGPGRDCLVPARSPGKTRKQTSTRKRSGRQADSSAGYRPHRKGAGKETGRRSRKPKN